MQMPSKTIKKRLLLI